jgi:hypothetical protein
VASKADAVMPMTLHYTADQCLPQNAKSTLEQQCSYRLYSSTILDLKQHELISNNTGKFRDQGHSETQSKSVTWDYTSFLYIEHK